MVGRYMKHRNNDSDNAIDTLVDPGRRRLLLGMVAVTGTAALGAGAWLNGADAANAGNAAGSTAVKRVRIAIFDNSGQRLGDRMLPMIVKTEAEWRGLLDPLAYKVTRHAGTERAFSGHHLKPEQSGIYRCICCDTALYDAATQFHSGTGWPSFWQPIAQENVRERVDTRLWMQRTEIECTRCAAHLGHVFNDGPPPTGLRYCMNAVAMRFATASGKPTTF